MRRRNSRSCWNCCSPAPVSNTARSFPASAAGGKWRTTLIYLEDQTELVTADRCGSSAPPTPNHCVGEGTGSPRPATVPKKAAVFGLLDVGDRDVTRPVLVISPNVVARTDLTLPVTNECWTRHQWPGATVKLRETPGRSGRTGDVAVVGLCLGERSGAGREEGCDDGARQQATDGT